MALKMRVLFLAVMMGSASALESSEVSISQFSSGMSAKAMESVFFRSEATHSKSMAAIMSGMSDKMAWQILEKHNLTTPALVSVMHKRQSNLRKAAPTGYAAEDGARKLLNDMIYEAMEKYDTQITECTEYYAQMCAEMETCRGKIAAANFEAANSRSLILDAQKTINKAQVDIPTTKLELKTHNTKCENQLSRMKARLAIVEGDVAVLTNILKMTDCDSTLVQMKKLALLHCNDPCTKKSFITFNEDSLKQKVSQLQSSLSHGLLQDTFKDLFQGEVGLESLSFLQLEAGQTPLINKTKFNNPPLPRTDVPTDPCTDKAAGAPSYSHKNQAKCTITASPQCYKLQERFLLIQAGVKDERDNLLSEISFTEEMCEETTNTLQSQIQDDQDRLGEAQTRLAGSMTKEADAAEQARKVAQLNEKYDNDLKNKMETCSKNYIEFETQLCALKKIRGELYKMKGGHQAFFQDCVVSKWDPEECSKVCGGGEQKLVRNILTKENGGAKCVPLDAVKKCNMQPCPVDCHLSAWNGWSKCSAQCGGGVRQRLREVKVAMKFGGKPCDGTSQTEACNDQACEKDCVLDSWTKWSRCSKDCDGGTQKRQKFVKEAAEGAGKCAGRWSKERLEYKNCNMHACQLKMGASTLSCNEKLDVVMLLDGSGSLGQKGWNAEMKAAQLFLDAFSGTGAQAQMSVILYSGPRTWGGVFKCFSKHRKVNMETVCKIKTATHFTSNLQSVKAKVAGLTWPRGSTLTSLALLKAQAELSLGRKDAKSIVVAITDGRPLSYRATGIAARYIRKSARLVWVAVTKYAPLKQIKKWATRRWQENVVRVKTFADLEKPDAVTHVIANICPSGNATAFAYSHWGSSR